MKTIEYIIDVTEQMYELPKGSIHTYKRTKTYAEARQVAMYLSRRYTKASLAEIAEVFNRDSSTIVQAVKRVAKELL